VRGKEILTKGGEMNPKELVQQARRIIQTVQNINLSGGFDEALEFIRVYTGEKSSFYVHLSQVNPFSNEKYKAEHVSEVLEAFIRYVENGLLGGVSIERQAQIDVVSDFLEQAQSLLNADDVHSAAPTMIIGAALEEFLRNWVEKADLNIQGNPSIDSYAKALRGDELITKQDMKDITSCAGLRNHAAHGEWDEVSDKKRITVMLESVNLFMRKYGAG